MGKRKDIIGVMSNLVRLLQINHDLCHKGTNISESCKSISQIFLTLMTILNLWNDFRKVVKFIDENPWVKPMLEKIREMK